MTLLYPDGCYAVLYGNLAPNGCLVKKSGVVPEMFHHRGPAVCFDSEDDLREAMANKQIKPGCVLVIRYEGPKGGPGMREMSIPVILIPFLITGFSKFAQGSASVAALRAAGLSVPLCEAGLITPLVAFLSISAGSALGSHVNNSFFWVFSKFMGYDAKTTMKTLCVAQNVVMAISGIAATYVVSLIA